MTFHYPTPNQSPAQNTSPAMPQGGNGRVKEPKTRLAYLNLYLPTADGGRVKLVSDLTLGLYLEKAGEKQLVELIKNGVIDEKQAAGLIQVEISLTRDESQPLVLDLGSLGIVNPNAQ